jgi:hypothetical protein
MSPTWSLEPEDASAGFERHIWLRKELFVLRMDYIPEVVRRIKALRHRAYVENRHWWFFQPLPEVVHEIEGIVSDFGFTVSDDARPHLARIGKLYRDIQLDARLRSVRRFIFASPGGDTLIHFPKDYLIADHIHDFIGAVWDKRVGGFRVPSDTRVSDALIALMEDFDFYIEEAVYERILNTQLPMFDDEDFVDEPLAAIDRTLYWMLLRMPDRRRALLFDAVRNYRGY